MLFMIHVSLALSLIALVAGTMLMVRAGKEDVCCKGFVKAVGIIVVILSLLMAICIGYHSFKYWKDPSSMMMGKGGMGMMHHRMMEMMKPEMREKMMKECPMMKKMMEEQGEEKEGKKDSD